MSRFGGASDGVGADDLRAAAMRALQEALRRPGRDREGAFALLAADGLLTYAVEDLASSSDPEWAFSALLAEVAAAAEGSGE
jgi:hypothetical protein